jgi:hypothetical protein
MECERSAMIDQSHPFNSLWFISWIVWKIPSRRPIKMAGFSHTEAGSSLDMLAAAEAAQTPDLRKKFFRHAMDEFRHARLFAERSLALASGGKATDVLEDPEYLLSHGIKGQQSLYEKLGELDFLTFVWLHEKQAGRQFKIYAELMKKDPNSLAMFTEICRDEAFHVDYSRRELDRIARTAGEKLVQASERRLRLQGIRDGFLRASHGFGTLAASFWLLLLYVVAFGSFSPITRKLAVEKKGFVATPGSLARARAEAGVQG